MKNLNKVTLSQVKAVVRKYGEWQGRALANNANPRSPWFNNAGHVRIVKGSLPDEFLVVNNGYFTKLESYINEAIYYIPRELGTRLAWYETEDTKESWYILKDDLKVSRVELYKSFAMLADREQLRELRKNNVRIGMGKVDNNAKTISMRSAI